MKPISEASELELREMKAPWPQTEEELAAYIQSLVDRKHDYGTCVYAMSMAAVAAFQFVAHKLGVTGFQASCADMDVIRRTRSLKHGFMIVDYENLLYPQYDVLGRVQESLTDMLPKMAPAARELLAKRPEAHPDVVSHWQKAFRFRRTIEVILYAPHKTPLFVAKTKCSY